jgi:hypothetical protein
MLASWLGLNHLPNVHQEIPLSAAGGNTSEESIGLIEGTLTA